MTSASVMTVGNVRTVFNLRRAFKFWLKLDIPSHLGPRQRGEGGFADAGIQVLVEKLGIRRTYSARILQHEHCEWELESSVKVLFHRHVYSLRVVVQTRIGVCARSHRPRRPALQDAADADPRGSAGGLRCKPPSGRLAGRPKAPRIIGHAVPPTWVR